MKKKKHIIKVNHLPVLLLIIIILLILFTKPSHREDAFTEPDESYNTAEQETDEYAVARKSMVDTQLRVRDVTDEKVLKVMEKVPRHAYMPVNMRQYSYEDHPVPIGYGQTISQPYIVALMTQELDVDEDDRVLEIGTGSGYQASVLAELVDEVYTIEIIWDLAVGANQTIKQQGYENIFVKYGDGYYGWPDKAPFDAIIVTAAANHIPPQLLNQLKDGGKLIIPLGETLRFQTLTIVKKSGDDLDTRFITGVRFVPLTGKAQE